jgi:hypothetical protein
MQATVAELALHARTPRKTVVFADEHPLVGVLRPFGAQFDLLTTVSASSR